MCLLRLSLGDRNSKRPSSLSKPLSEEVRKSACPPPLVHTHLFIPLGTAGSSLRVGVREGIGGILGWHSLSLRYLGKSSKAQRPRWRVVAGRRDRVKLGVQGGREGGVWWVGAWLGISDVTYKGWAGGGAAEKGDRGMESRRKGRLIPGRGLAKKEPRRGVPGSPG